MIFLAGVHGSGKTTIGKRLEKELQIKCYTASALIEKVVRTKMPVNKKINDIDLNQSVLERQISILNKNNDIFILEGHFCLLDKSGKITRIRKGTFLSLHIDKIIVLVDDAEKISERNKEKGQLLSTVEFIIKFQKEEICYGKLLAKELKVPFLVAKNSDCEFEKIKLFICR